MKLPFTKKWLAVTYSTRYGERVTGEFDTKKEAEVSQYRYRGMYETYSQKRNPDYKKE